MMNRKLVAALVTFGLALPAVTRAQDAPVEEQIVNQIEQGVRCPRRIPRQSRQGRRGRGKVQGLYRSRRLEQGGAVRRH